MGVHAGWWGFGSDVATTWVDRLEPDEGLLLRDAQRGYFWNSPDDRFPLGQFRVHPIDTVWKSHRLDLNRE